MSGCSIKDNIYTAEKKTYIHTKNIIGKKWEKHKYLIRAEEEEVKHAEERRNVGPVIATVDESNN